MNDEPGEINHGKEGRQGKGFGRGIRGGIVNSRAVLQIGSVYLA